jgi:hypothetical protein
MGIIITNKTLTFTQTLPMSSKHFYCAAICLALIFNFCYGQTTQLTSHQQDSIKAASEILTKKMQIGSMIYAGGIEFKFDQPSTVPVFEDPDTHKKYYTVSLPFQAGPFKSAIALIQEESRNSVLYKTVIFGWTTDNQTAEEDEDDADYAKAGVEKVIKEKEKTGLFRSTVTSNADGTTRTELRDSLGGIVLETVLHKDYFQLIVYGKTWRTAPQKDMTASFMIKPLLALKNKRRTIKSVYPFEFIGDKSRVSLYAASKQDDVIFAVDNPTEKTVHVKIKIAFQCVEKALSTSYQTQEIVWTITVAANSQKSYDTDQAACIVEGCRKKTNAWKIVEWVVE